MAGTHSVRAVATLVLLFAGHFDDQVQEFKLAVAIVDAGDKVGDVVLFFAVQRVGDIPAGSVRQVSLASITFRAGVPWRRTSTSIPVTAPNLFRPTT